MKSRVIAAFVVTFCAGLLTFGSAVEPALAATKPCKGVGTALKKNGKPVSNSGKENGGKLFRGRASMYEEDQERVLGATANISGFTTTVLATQVVPEVGQFESDGYLKVTVRVCNRDQRPQRWSTLNWKLQTPSGNTVDPDIVVSAPTLDYSGGELVQDGRVEGDVYFTVGNPPQSGAYYVLYQPDLFTTDETRGVWQITI